MILINESQNNKNVYKFTKSRLKPAALEITETTKNKVYQKTVIKLSSSSESSRSRGRPLQMFSQNYSYIFQLVLLITCFIGLIDSSTDINYKDIIEGMYFDLLNLIQNHSDFKKV